MFKIVLKNDIKYMEKDPMVWMIFITPILFSIIYRAVIVRLKFLDDYHRVFQYIFVVMIPFLIGMALGFRMLDEKDENMLSFYAVSPLGLSGYIKLRMVMSIILVIVSMAIIGLFGVVPRAYLLLVSLEAVLLAPLVFLILGVIGKNKIQGLTLVKIMGMFFMVPVLKVIKDNPLDKIFVFVPSYNIFQLIVREEFSSLIVLYIGFMVIGVCFLTHLFINKCITDI
ncbi:MAG: transporter permease [Clostridia bacterium]|jgi:fluoroquinolone transport system permease protein|nr:transporter permease [Clostridia bacterium]